MDLTHDDIDSAYVDSYMHDNFITLEESLSVESALQSIRMVPDDGRVIYYYTRDSESRLTGVVPARALLSATPDQPLTSISKKDLVRVEAGSTMREVAHLFASYKYLSLPVVDSVGRVVGVVDLKPFTKKEIDVSDRALLDEIFQTIGIRVSKILSANAIRTFGYRFPWLVSTLLSGVLCAVLAGVFEQTLTKSIIIAFFITLVLALGESVSIQSMSIALQLIHTQDRARPGKYLGRLAKEALTGALIGLACGAIAFGLSAAWKGQITASLAIGASVALSILVAMCIGLSVPMLLHAIRKDPRIASGPLALAATDICTVLIYLSTARLLLG